MTTLLSLHSLKNNVTHIDFFPEKLILRMIEAQHQNFSNKISDLYIFIA